jgi:membrane dipeptidase
MASDAARKHDSPFPPIFDGHNDTLLSLHLPERGGERSFFARGERGHLDLPRAQEGGLGGGFFAMFVPNPPGTGGNPEETIRVTEDGYVTPLAPPIDLAYAQRTAMALFRRLIQLEAESAGRLRVVRDVAGLEACLREGVLAAVAHFEGAEAIDPDLDALHVFYQAGLRSLGPVWSRANDFGQGVPFVFPASPDTGPGLTEAGKALVRACGELGILLDLAHLNERGFWDVAALSSAPLVVTHAGVHALCPASRNVTDRQLDAIGETGGVLGIVFEPTMLREDGYLITETPLEVIARHVAYVAERIGIEHVALGSDFDGAVMPDALPDAAALPALMTALRAHGFDDAALRQIAHENWLRVLRQTWRA